MVHIGAAMLRVETGSKHQEIGSYPLESCNENGSCTMPSSVWRVMFLAPERRLLSSIWGGQFSQLLVDLFEDRIPHLDPLLPTNAPSAALLS